MGKSKFGKAWVDPRAFHPDHSSLHAPANGSSDREEAVRRNEATLETNQRERFLYATDAVSASGDIAVITPKLSDHLRSLHTDSFLPRARLILKEVEDILRGFDAKVFIPYWQWSVHPTVPEWIRGWCPRVLRTVKTMDAGTRALQNIPDATSLMNWMRIPSFDELTSRLSDLFIQIPSQVGGSMKDPMLAAASPLYWMHMAEIDRIWCEWQKRHPNLHPRLETNTLLDSMLCCTEADTRNTQDLGYQYR